MRAQVSGRRRGLRSGIGACIAVAMLASLGLAAASGVGRQDAATQSIEVTLGKGTTTVSGADTLVAGLTKITARNTGSAPASFLLGRLRPGKTFADLQAAAQRTDQIPEGVVLVVDVVLRRRSGKSFVTTIKLPAGDYVTAQPPNQGKGVGPSAQFSIANGTAGGSPPATTGTVVLYDYGINAPKSISGRGTLKINNIGQNYHFLESSAAQPRGERGPGRRRHPAPAGSTDSPPARGSRSSGSSLRARSTT